MNPPENNDPLDALLREQDAYIEDGGFTARVTAALPKRRRSFQLRTIILLGAVMLGSALAACWLPLGEMFAPSQSDVISINAQTILLWLPVIAVAASVIWGIVAAFQWED
ncbi:MAG: hypothetical protein JWQ71_4412 [Pedosphaera sp.]|nr:hypothetical protein [Pedosphaera sp.]